MAEDRVLQRRKPLFIVGIVVLCILGAWFAYFLWQIGYSVVLLSHGQDPTKVAQQKQFQASIAKSIANTHVTKEDLARLESTDEPTLGNPQAKIHIVEFVDYDCPYCRQVAPVIRAFMQKHSQDAYLTLRDFPITELHPDAERLAVAARCVFAQKDSRRFWLFYDRLYASQSANSAQDLRLYAEQQGVNLSAYDACVSSQQTLPHVQQSVQDGLAAGVNATPTFFFNGLQIPGAIDADSMEVIFSEAQKQAKAL